jgi:hypothetical protein
VWYQVSTAVNVGEPLFRLGWAVVLLYRVLREAKKRFAFEMCGFRLDGKWLTVYIKPVDGFKLPKIMQWMMNEVHDELRSLSRLSRLGSMCGRGGRARVEGSVLVGDFGGGAGSGRERGGLGGSGRGSGQGNSGGHNLLVVLGQPPLGWNDGKFAVFVQNRSRPRVPVRLISPVHGQKG